MGGQSLANFDYDLAPGVAKTFIKKVKDIMEVHAFYKEIIIKVNDELKAKMNENNGHIIDDAKEVLANYFVNSFDIFDLALKWTERDTYQAMEALIHNLNTMHSRAGAQVPFSSINYGTDTSTEGRMVIKQLLDAEWAGLGNGETPIFPIHIFRVKDGINGVEGDPNYDLFELACKVSAKRLFPNFEFLDAPYNAQYLKKLPNGEYDPNSMVATMGCVAPESVISYTLDDTLYVESIFRLFKRIEQKVSKKENEVSEWMDTRHLNLKIWDSRTNAFVKVKTVLRNHNADIHWKKVTFKNGRLLGCTDDHPLPIDGLGRTFVRDIPEGSEAPITTYVPHVPTKRKIKSDDAWLAGMILCDGSLHGRVTVSVGLDERDLVDEMCRLSAEPRIAERHRGVKGDYYGVTIGGKLNAEYYINLFGGERKIERQIPNFIFGSSREIRLQFLAGMIDADGHINKHTNGRGIGLRVQIGSTNRELALQQMMLAQSVGLSTKCYESSYAGDERTAYRVEFAATKEILSLLRCAKKRNTMNLPGSYPMTPILPSTSPINRIEDADYGEYSYDVETESDYFDVNGIVSHNCRTRVMGNVYDPSYEMTTGRGNLSFSTINLPRIGLKHRGDIDGFFKELDEKIDLVFDQLLERFEVQAKRKVKNFPFLMGQGCWKGSDELNPDDEIREIIKHGTLTTGFIGLAESLTALIGKHHAESEEAQELGLAIISHMRKRCDEQSQKMKLNFSLIATPAEGLSGVFTAIDKKEFGEIKGITDRKYYTNSFHVPVWYNIGATKKLQIEAPYHALCNGGHISYVELDGDPLTNVPAFIELIQYMKQIGIGYGSINHPVDHCPICGYTGIIGDECPRCHLKEGQEITHEQIKAIRKECHC